MCWFPVIKSTRSARLFNDSSFSLFLKLQLKLQKCHTTEQYWKRGRAKSLYNCSMVEVFTSLRNLTITFSWLLTFLQISETCLSKFNWLSIVIPRRPGETLVVKQNWWSVNSRTMAWCLLGSTIIPFSVYQVFAFRTSHYIRWSRAIESESESYNCSSSAYMKLHFFDDMHRKGHLRRYWKTSVREHFLVVHLFLQIAS